MGYGNVPDGEPSSLPILKAKDVRYGLVLQPMPLIPQRLAVGIADRLPDLRDHRTIGGLGETHRLGMRVNKGPLAGPIRCDGFKSMTIAATHAIGQPHDRVIRAHGKPRQQFRRPSR